MTFLRTVHPFLRIKKLKAQLLIEGYHHRSEAEMLEIHEELKRLSHVDTSATA